MSHHDDARNCRIPRYLGMTSWSERSDHIAPATGVITLAPKIGLRRKSGIAPIAGRGPMPRADRDVAARSGSPEPQTPKR
jgi:hypothetical protein